MSIDPSSDTPLYQQISEDLRRQIRSGALPTGTRLPPIRQLTTLYGVSIITINKALASLVSDGLVDSHVGRGTFVSPLPESLKPRVIGELFVVDTRFLKQAAVRGFETLGGSLAFRTTRNFNLVLAANYDTGNDYEAWSLGMSSAWRW